MAYAKGIFIAKKISFQALLMKKKDIEIKKKKKKIKNKAQNLSEKKL